MDKTEGDPGWRALWKMALGQRVRLLFALLLTAVAVACELLPYWVIFQALDVLLYTQVALGERLYQLAGWMAAALLLKTIFYALAYMLSHQAAYSILVETRKILVARLAWAPLNWLQQYNSGQLKQLVLQDVEKIETVISHHTVEVFAALASPLLVTAYLFWIDWRLALAALVTAPLAVLASALFMRDSSDQYVQYSEASAALESATVEYLRNMPVMKVFRQDTKNFHSMRKRLENYYGVVGELTKKTVPGWALFTSLLGANIFFILPVGAWLYAMSVVTLSQVIMAVVLGSGMLKPLLKVSRFFMEINEVLAGLRRLAPVLDLETRDRVGCSDISAPVTVVFRDVSFGYTCEETGGEHQPIADSDQNALGQINLTLLPGSFTVLLGPSGAGKSTLAQLLGGLLLADVGSITVNNVPVVDLSNAQRAALIGVVTQEAFLFKGSIRDNICLARPEATDQEIAAAVRVAQAEALITSLPQGYNTLVNEQGVRLSGGERQRIAIARALLADTPLLVLDEASASLDNITQQAFYREIKTQFPNKSILMIAHRCYGLENADQIVVLKQGRIQALGEHRELLLCNAFYQRLWQCQADCETWSIRAEDKLQEDMDV